MTRTPSPFSGPTRFVILHHELPAGEHWDFMVEAGRVLWTWRLAANPVLRPADEIPARRIEDHRTAYLSYEGPVSGDRGTVARVEEGTCSVEELTGEHVRLDLRGVRLRGRYQLPMGEEEAGLLRPLP